MIEDKDLDVMKILAEIHAVKEKAVEDYKKDIREKIGKMKPVQPTIRTNTYHQGVSDTFTAVLGLLEEKKI